MAASIRICISGGLSCATISNMQLKHHDKLDEYIRAENVSWHRVFCFNGQIGHQQLLTDIEQQTGIKLHAKKEDDVVHGFVSCCRYPASLVSRTCSWGLEPITVGVEHTCVIVSLYAADKPPSFDPLADPKARIGHKTHLKAIAKDGIEEKLLPV